MSAWEFDRKELLGKLKLVAPALAKQKAALVAPQFEQLWFTDYGVFACNDQIALATALDADDGFIGGVHGERLLKLLAGSSNDVIEFSDNGDGRLVVEGEFKATLNTHDYDPPFVWPQPDDDVAPIEVDADFLAACKLSKTVIDAQHQSLQARGMTILQNGNGVALYATDRNAMVRVRLDQPGGERPMVILSLAFIEQILRLGEGALSLADDYALFAAEKATLWGRYVLPEPELLAFEEELEKRRPPSLSPLPPGFRAAIVRAGVMAAAEEKRVPIEMRVGGGVLTLAGSGPSGEVVEELAPFHHAPLTLRFNQRLVERVGGNGLTHLGLVHNALVFTSEDEHTEYVIAAH